MRKVQKNCNPLQLNFMFDIFLQETYIKEKENFFSSKFLGKRHRVKALDKNFVVSQYKISIFKFLIKVESKI